MRRGKWIGIIAVALACLSAGGWYYFSRPAKGNIDTALKKDFTTMDGTQMSSFLAGLRFEGSTPQQQLALFTRMKSAFDAMNPLQKIDIMLEVRKVFMSDPRGKIADNMRKLMQEYWAQEMDKYAKASPEEKTKMLDARIDEEVTMETLQKAQDAAKAIFGGNGQPNADAVRMVETQIMQGMVDSMENRPPQERAQMSDYFSAMRDRRLARGLPVLF